MLGLAAWALLAQSVDFQEVPTPRQHAVANLQASKNWLLGQQEPDGSFGHWRNPLLDGSEQFWFNPYTHYSWQVATTAIAATALLDSADWAATKGMRDAPSLVAAEKALQFLQEQSNVQRPSDWDTDHTWALVYGLAGLTHAAGHPHFSGPERREWQATTRASAERLIQRLEDYQTAHGGWAYYADETKAVRPHWATSFQTAVAVLTLLEARALDWSVDEDRLGRAVHAVAQCRLPNGAYSYSVDLFPTPGGLDRINQIKGSLGRIPLCDLALLLGQENGFQKEGVPDLDRADIRLGLDRFFGDHRFLEIAAGRPNPHEAYYQNSGYFYFFGHFYAGEALLRLSSKDGRHYAPKLWRESQKFLEKDGSTWDYPMNSFDRVYSTAYSISAVARTLRQFPQAGAASRSD